MYLIANYEDRYKPYDKSGGDLKNPSWVKLPANPKGDGLQVLLERSRGLEIFGIWCLLLEKATLEKKPENRGKLLNHKELPASISEIAKGISLSAKIKLVEIALTALVEMGWVINDKVAEVERKPAEETPAYSSVVKSSVEYSTLADLFAEFWEVFKGRWNADKSRFDKGGKKEALEEWKKLKPEQHQLAIKAASKTGDKFTKDACRWLKYHRWDDFEVDKPKPIKPKIPPKEQELYLTPDQKKAKKAQMEAKKRVKLV